MDMQFEDIQAVNASNQQLSQKDWDLCDFCDIFMVKMIEICPNKMSFSLKNSRANKIILINAIN